MMQLLSWAGDGPTVSGGADGDGDDGRDAGAGGERLKDDVN
jgi:hypothetical protein